VIEKKRKKRNRKRETGKEKKNERGEIERSHFGKKKGREVLVWS
jgi:hypothetical protein